MTYKTVNTLNMCIQFVWQGLGSRGLQEWFLWEADRSCPCVKQPMPACSKANLLLAKAESIGDSGLGLRGHPVAAYCYWYYKEYGGKLFSAGANNTPRRNGHKLWLESFRLEIRKNVFNGWDSVILEKTSNTDGSPASDRRLNWMVSRNSFQTTYRGFNRSIALQICSFLQLQILMVHNFSLYECIPSLKDTYRNTQYWRRCSALM